MTEHVLQVGGRMFRLLVLLMALVVTASAFVAITAPAASAQEDPVRILILNKNPGHGSHVQADAAVHDLAAELAADEGVVVEVDETNSTAQFADLTYLQQYDTIVFSYTGGVVFTSDAERDGFQAYIQAGGGYVGLHYAAWSAGVDSEHDVWPWYHDLLGAVSVHHPENPQFPTADVHVTDTSHPLTAGLDEVTTRSDEWYDWVVNPANDVRVLLEVDESSYSDGEIGRNGTKHPVTWCQEYDGGRSWFTSMAHFGEHWSEPFMRTQLRHGLAYTAGLLEADCSPREKDEVGAWSDVTPWPLVPINASLTADGKVQTFGSVIPRTCGDDTRYDWSGNSCVHQGGQFEIDVWDPSQERTLETVTDGVVPNTTYTDLFCSIQVNDPNRRVTLTMGGDDSLGGNAPNEAAIGVTSWSDRTGLQDEAPMKYPRWYPTSTVMPNGDIVVQGGSLYGGPGGPGALTPELYTPDEGNGWRSLEGATSEAAYGNGGPGLGPDENRWWYPRAFVAPEGHLFNVSGTATWSLDPYANAGDGELTMHDGLPAAVANQGPLGNPVGATSTAVMYEPGKILQVGGGHWVNGGGPAGARAGFTVDLTTAGGSAEPAYAATEPMAHRRHWANSTVLPDGKVLVTGGGVNNAADGDLANTPEIWDPSTGTWQSDLATAQHGRLYHSTALLLPDGRVMVGGGGTPGPRNYTDVEFYSPAYLFDGDELAARPQITDAPSEIGHGGAFDVDVSEEVDRVTLVRSGSVTHSFNNDQRFQELDFAATGDGRITVNAPEDANDAPPGTYMLFVWNADGTPSVAELVQIDPEVENDHRTPLVVDQFEYPRVPASWSSGSYPGSTEVQPGDGRMAPWTVDTTVRLVRGTLGSNGGLGKTGTHVNLGADGQLSRALTGLQPGREYRIALRYARDSAVAVPDGGVVSADVTVGDLDDTIVAGPDVPSDSDQITSGTYVATFTADERTETLTLAASGTSAGVIVDDLVVIGTEPGLEDVPVHYAFEEGEGTTAANTGTATSVGAATLTGSTGWSEAGVFGSALDLPGGDRANAVDLPDDLLRDETDFAVSFWVEPDALTNWAGLFHIGNGESSFFQIQTQTQAAGSTGLAVTFKAADAPLQERIYAAPTQDVTIGRWNHVAFTRQGSTGTLYLEGEPIASRDDLTIDMADIGATVDNWLGRNGFPDAAFDGRMDEVRLYTSTLSASDVAALYADGAALRTTTTIEASPPSPAPFGEPVTITATVADESGEDAQGTALLEVDGSIRGSAVAVTDGQASFEPLELSPGEHTVTVRFTAADGYRDSEASIAYTVERPPPGEGVPIHWSFDEGQGTTSENLGSDPSVGDAVLNNGNVTWTSDGRYDDAVDLPGGGSASGNFVDLPDDLMAGMDDEFTVSIWTNPRQLPTWVPLFQVGSSTDTFFLLQSNLGTAPGGFGATFKQAGDPAQHRIFAGRDLPLNEWTHVVFTMRGSTARIYFDGELVGERTDVPISIGDVGVDGSTTANFLGNTSWPDPMWNGVIDEVRIYDYELSAEDVLELHQYEPDVATTIAATADEVELGDEAEVVATVTPSEATGTVEVRSGDTVLGSAELASGTGTVTFDTDGFELGTHELTVEYPGEAGFTGSSTTVDLVVVEPVPDDVDTSVSASAEPVAPGEDGVVAVTVSPTAATGAVELVRGATVLDTAELADGEATLTVAADELAEGANVLTVRYLGADGFRPSSTLVVVQVVSPPAAERTTVTAAAGDVVAGDDAEVLAVVDPIEVTGTVEVRDGDRVVGSGELDDGVATIVVDTEELELGSNVFVVRYVGADGYRASQTLVVVRVVSDAADPDTDPDPDPDPDPGPKPDPTMSVCDPLSEYDRGRFSDTRGSAHERNLLCMAALGLTEGLAGGDEFGPRLDVNRGQMAAFIARLIETATGEQLEAGRRFDDVPSGYAHALSISKLAAIGVTEGTGSSGGAAYAPLSRVTRAQMASFIRRALTYIADGQGQPETVPADATRDHFGDDDGSVHERNIDALAEVDIVEGFGDGTYRVDLPVKRDQMASFVVRAYDHAVDAGLAADPGTR